MTLQERLADANTRAAKLYLQRQQIEAQRQQIQQQAVLCEQALLKTDGEVDLLHAMIKDDARGQ